MSSIQKLITQLPEHLQERCLQHAPDSESHRAGRYVLYWTHHALRCDENPALDVAIHLANHLQLPLLVYQGLSEAYRFASDRHHTFILEAAIDLAARYRERGISYLLHVDRSESRQPRLAQLARHGAVLITEDFPIEATRQWTDRLAEQNRVPMVLVDTACVVPMRMVGKAYDRAFAYRTATEKHYAERIDRQWPQVQLETAAAPLPFESLQLAAQNLPEIVAQCNIDHTIGPVSDTRGGSTAGYERWQAFRRHGLAQYAKRRNTIEIDGVSRVSAYLHYGMVSPMRLAREASQDRADKYLDELLIWRELAYTFCYYRRDLESESAIPAWAIQTLRKHASDLRETHTWETLARARTGNALWDAAQRSLIKHGELHNNVRMTWGKAICGWSRDYLIALKHLIDLNHRYALDGRDPASYGGLLWCLGQFDRPFTPEQPVFGSVRTRPLDEHAARTNLPAYERRVDRPIASPLPSIAIIGAGLGGLICARTLCDHGLQVQSYDKSNRPAGRTATRSASIATNERLKFDHGAQYFTIRDSRLNPYLEAWCEDGIVARWHGRVVSIDQPAQTQACAALARYVGVPDMQSLAKHLSEDVPLQLDCEIERVVQRGDQYELIDTAGMSHGPFDTILWNCPPAQIDAILGRSTLQTAIAWHSRLSQVTMQPCWAVMIALRQPWQVAWDGAFVNCGSIAWMARNSSKPSRSTELDTWVLHSTVDWASNHLDLSKDQAAEQLLAEAVRVTGVPLPEATLVMAHRWLYSRPAQPLSEAALWDAGSRMGACGDWCGAARVEGALLSGMALAGRVLGQLHASMSSMSSNANRSANTSAEPSQLRLF